MIQEVNASENESVENGQVLTHLQFLVIFRRDKVICFILNNFSLPVWTQDCASLLYALWTLMMLMINKNVHCFNSVFHINIVSTNYFTGEKQLPHSNHHSREVMGQVPGHSERVCRQVQCKGRGGVMALLVVTCDNSPSSLAALYRGSVLDKTSKQKLPSLSCQELCSVLSECVCCLVKQSSWVIELCCWVFRKVIELTVKRVCWLSLLQIVLVGYLPFVMMGSLMFVLVVQINFQDYVCDLLQGQ